MPQGPSVGRKRYSLFPLLKAVAGWGKGKVWVQIPALTLLSQWTAHSISLNLRQKSTSHPPG